MDEKTIFQTEVLSKLTSQIEKECGFKNAAFLITFILLCIDPKTWTVDKSYLAKFYQAIDIIEKNEELKNLFQGVKKEASDGVSENQIQNDRESKE